MDIIEAIQARHSVRRYTDAPIEEEKVNALKEVIKEINAESGLHFQFVVNEPEAFSGTMAHYGHFSGVKNYFVLAGKKRMDREVGYYGEKLVLAAQMLGLNTCWVALTFNKKKTEILLDKGEKFYVVISVGYGITQGKPHPSKSAQEIGGVTDASPDWYKKGIEAVLLAPTAVDQQKFTFTLNGDTVTSKPGVGFYTDMDLGIAQYHFDMATGKRCFGL